jgi:hypothetical protein
LALGFTASFEGGATSKPDYGDQVDFRHAAYAGAVDVFVTEDRKMAELLSSKLCDARAKIVHVEEFLTRLRAGDLKE